MGDPEFDGVGAEAVEGVMNRNGRIEQVDDKKIEKKKEKKVEIKRRIESRSEPAKKWKNDTPSKNPTDWGFSCSDFRLRARTTPVKSLAPPMGSVKRKTDEKLAKSVALLVKDVKIPKPAKPAPKITQKNPVKKSPSKGWSPAKRALRNGSPAVAIFDPRKPKSDINPRMAVDKNDDLEGKKFLHGDYNKKAKKPVDAETETDDVKARHVQLSTPVRVGPTILDPNQYIREDFLSFQRVPELEAEVELQKLQRISVEGEFRDLRRHNRELELAMNGARRERDDARESEAEARNEVLSLLEKVESWKKRAEQQRKAKNKEKERNEKLNEKVLGKMLRALERLSVKKGETDGGERAKKEMSEVISKDTADPEEDWSGSDATF